MDGPRGEVDGVTLTGFGGAVVIGGANFVAVKLTVEDLAPLWGASTRFAAAAVVFLGILVLTRTPFPRGAALVGAALYGALGFGVAYALARGRVWRTKPSSAGPRMNAICAPERCPRPSAAGTAACHRRGLHSRQEAHPAPEEATHLAQVDQRPGTLQPRGLLLDTRTRLEEVSAGGTNCGWEDSPWEITSPKRVCARADPEGTGS